jgi:hypothetical protein
LHHGSEEAMKLASPSSWKKFVQKFLHCEAPVQRSAILQGEYVYLKMRYYELKIIIIEV